MSYPQVKGGESILSEERFGMVGSTEEELPT
jgi:hypothetical protein